MGLYDPTIAPRIEPPFLSLRESPREEALLSMSNDCRVWPCVYQEHTGQVAEVSGQEQHRGKDTRKQGERIVVVPCEFDSSACLCSAACYSMRSQFGCIFKALGAAVGVEDTMKL